MKRRAVMLSTVLLTALLGISLFIIRSGHTVHTANVTDGVAYSAYSNSLGCIVCICANGKLLFYSNDLSQILRVRFLDCKHIKSACIRDNVLYIASASGLERIQIDAHFTLSQKLISGIPCNNVHADTKGKYIVYNTDNKYYIKDVLSMNTIAEGKLVCGTVFVDSCSDRATVCLTCNTKCIVENLHIANSRVVIDVRETITALHVNANGNVLCFTEHNNVFIDGMRHDRLSQLLVRWKQNCVVTKSIAIDRQQVLIGFENGGIAIIDVFNDTIIEVDPGFCSRVIGIERLSDGAAFLLWSHTVGNNDMPGNAMIAVINKLSR